VGSVMMLVASAIVWSLLDVKHEELAKDAEENPELAAAHVG
jgi:hypothetical protein